MRRGSRNEVRAQAKSSFSEIDISCKLDFIYERLFLVKKLGIHCDFYGAIFARFFENTILAADGNVSVTASYVHTAWKRAFAFFD